MASLQIDATKFANEREVVKEERAACASTTSRSDGCSKIIDDKAFTTHPLPARDDRQHGEDLQAATTKDVIDFH